MTNTKVVEIDGESAGLAAGEDDAVFAERTRRSTRQAHDAVFPSICSIRNARAADLIASKLVDGGADFEKRAETFAGITF